MGLWRQAGLTSSSGMSGGCACPLTMGPTQPRAAQIAPLDVGALDQWPSGQGLPLTPVGPLRRPAQVGVPAVPGRIDDVQVGGVFADVGRLVLSTD